MREHAGWRVPVSLYAAPKDSVVEEYAEAGVDRILFYLPTKPRDESLERLDLLAGVVTEHS